MSTRRTTATASHLVRQHQHLGGEELNAFIDGELSVVRRREMKTDLDQCERCRGHWNALRHVADGIRTLPLDQLTPPLKLALGDQEKRRRARARLLAALQS